MKSKILFKYLVIPLFTASLLISCSTSPYVTTTDLCKNLPKMQYQSTVFNDRVYAFSLDFNNLDDSMKVYVFKKIEKLDQGGSFFLFDIIANLINPMQGTKYDFCAASFKNGYLYYWGYIDDYKKEADPRLQMIGEKLCEKLIKDED